MNFYTNVQQRVIFWAPKLPAALSMASSLYLAFLVAIRQPKLDKVYGRLWLGIALGNVIIAAMGGMLMSVPAPRGTYYGAMGNETTCTVAAALFHWVFVATMVYNGALGVYYYIAVHWRRATEVQVRKRVEPIFHFSAVAWPTAGVVVGTVGHYYNAHPIFLSCWAAPTPFGCSVNRDLDCVEGETLRPPLSLALVLLRSIQPRP